jgi:hypothetical protein
MPPAEDSTVRDPAPSWVRFAKLLRLYPRESERVRDAAADLLRSVDAARTATGIAAVRLALDGNRLVVAGLERAADEPVHPWLAERFRRSALVGVVLAPEVTAEELTDFTLRLLENHVRGRSEARFEVLWPESYAGIRPLARRFDGVFSEHVDGGRTGAAGAPALEEAPPWVMGVLQDVEVLRALERAARKDAGGQTVPLSALVERIRAQLPAEVAADAARAESVTRAVLANAIGARDASCADSLKGLIVSVSDGLFAREYGPEPAASAHPPRVDDPGPGAAPRAIPAADPFADIQLSAAPPPPAPVAHARSGDDAITDDLEAFLGEYDRLPDGPVRLHLAEADLVVEQLAVYLHYLLLLDSRPLASAAMKMITKLIDASEAKDLEVLVEFLGAGTEGMAATIARLGHVLQDERVLRALDTLGIFGYGWAIATFPGTFPFYLDSLNLSEMRAVSELCRACQAIGPERILAAGQMIAHESGLLRPAVARRILAAPFFPLTPLAALILRYGKEDVHADVAGFLRSIHTDAPGTCLLWLCEPEEIPRDYMLALMKHGSAEPNAELRRIIGRELCRIALAKEAEGAALERRLRAIDLMSEFPSLEVSDALTDLVEGKGLPRFSGASARIRAAADETIRRMKSRAHV